MRQLFLWAHPVDLKQVVWQNFAYVSSRTNLPFDISFRLEVLEGANDRRSGQVIGVGKVASRGKARPRSKSAIENSSAELFIQPAIKTNAAAAERQAQR